MNCFKILYQFLFSLFENGVDLNLLNLYPTIKWPVSRGTPMISPLIKWDHKEIYQYLKYDEKIGTDKKFMINLQDPEYEYITGHKIDGNIFEVMILLVYRDGKNSFNS